ncbi:MAG: hypothetical protein H6867_04255 [Rhodospirillales bacterium]|nr:hypothetical protein [Rhodospirillales bacterium]MCB9996362.1 hypothetical protein [Rhodospirillales bacterium]
MARKKQARAQSLPTTPTIAAFTASVGVQGFGAEGTEYLSANASDFLNKSIILDSLINDQTSGLILSAPAPDELVAELEVMERYFISHSPNLGAYAVVAGRGTRETLKDRFNDTLQKRWDTGIGALGLRHFWKDIDAQLGRLDPLVNLAGGFTTLVTFHREGAREAPRWHLDKHLPPHSVGSLRNIHAGSPEFALRGAFTPHSDGKSFDVSEGIGFRGDAHSIFKAAPAYGVVHRIPPAAGPTEKRWSILITGQSPHI